MRRMGGGFEGFCFWGGGEERELKSFLLLLTALSPLDHTHARTHTLHTQHTHHTETRQTPTPSFR
jgi:hypothetical protein